MLERIADGRVHFGVDHTTVPNNKTYLANTESQSLTSIRYVDGRAASKRLATLFGEKVFTNPKDELLLRDIYKAVGVGDDNVILDMFSGSASALHAVWELNVQLDIGAHFVGIQIAEDLNEALKTVGAARQVTSNAIKILRGLGAPTNIAEIGKERLRLAAAKVRERAPGKDFGFRSLRVASSNMMDVRLEPDETAQSALRFATDSVKPDRCSEDLLFQVLLDWGLELSMPISVEQVGKREVFIVDDGALIACFDRDVTPEVVRAMADRKPLRAVFLDAGFANDAARINAEQVFREGSPGTEVRAI
jgi:adenine-specific DNA-methyltransferase